VDRAPFVHARDTDMIFQLIFGPFSTLYQLGRLSVWAVLFSGLILGPILGAHKGVKGGHIQWPDQTILFIVLAILAVLTIMFSYVTVWSRWESNFDIQPWAAAQREKLSSKPNARVLCPFTGSTTPKTRIKN
jgi:hypothetical protein